MSFNSVFLRENNRTKKSCPLSPEDDVNETITCSCYLRLLYDYIVLDYYYMTITMTITILDYYYIDYYYMGMTYPRLYII